ncbi:MAG TPA: cytochrome P460 family protein [Terriglobales bacterium]|nr:cytochrome P460 family protein [Terriglobales bacterium]
MKKWALLGATVVLCLSFVAAASPDGSDKPQFSSDSQLLRPENYREWVFLSAGLGMTYSSAGMDHQMFTNVFVPRWAYAEFLKNGKWPDKTMFVVEERGSESKGSIVKGGHYQTVELMRIGVEVKDEARFPEKWAYFSFDQSGKQASPNPKPACWQCHEDHAAVEHSFVQFYPTLKPVSKKFGTYKESAEKPAD